MTEWVWPIGALLVGVVFVAIGLYKESRHRGTGDWWGKSGMTMILASPFLAALVIVL